MNLPEIKILNKSIKTEVLLVVLLILCAGILRFWNLGYSDYIGDEHKSFLIPSSNQTVWDFLILQRKGPVQFIISYIPQLFIGDFNNELAQRIPFSLISVAAVLVFYLFVKKFTKNTMISFISAFLFMVNGFIVGFGRISQYQNLNLLFSFLALFFYSDLLSKDKHLIRSTFLGTLFWCLSILSHWDGIFIIPLVLWIFIIFLRNSNFTGEYKARIIIYNFILGCIVLLPFIVPYVKFHSLYSSSEEYFSRRIGLGHSTRNLYKMFIDLYNPFITFWFLLIFNVIGSLRIKKSYPIVLWLVFSLLVFELFVRKPGTHIYNFLIPAFILCGFGVNFLSEVLPKKCKKIFWVFIFLTFSFLYYQSYLIFVDHKEEYPWDRKSFLRVKVNCSLFGSVCERLEGDTAVLKTKRYYYDYKGQKLPLFGFPHKRYWKEVNEYIVANSPNGKNTGYSSNEDRTVSRWYMDVGHKSMGTFYFVGIRNPVNFVVDMSPPRDGESELVKTFQSEDGTNQVKIYKVTTSNK